MRCRICKRKLVKPALTLPTRDGLQWIGPKCARRIAPRAEPEMRAVKRWRDNLTMNLFEDVT